MEATNPWLHFAILEDITTHGVYRSWKFFSHFPNIFQRLFKVVKGLPFSHLWTGFSTGGRLWLNFFIGRSFPCFGCCKLCTWFRILFKFNLYRLTSTKISCFTRGEIDLNLFFKFFLFAQLITETHLIFRISNHFFTILLGIVHDLRRD